MLAKDIDALDAAGDFMGVLPSWVLIPLAVMMLFAIAVLLWAVAQSLRFKRLMSRARNDTLENRQRRQLLIMEELKRRGRASAKRIRETRELSQAEFEHAVDYLTSKNLVKISESFWKPKWDIFDTRVFELTAAGEDELDKARQNPEDSTGSLGPWILVKGNKGNVSIQAGGHGNTMAQGKSIDAKGGLANLHDSPGASIQVNRARLLDFIEDYSDFLDQFGGDPSASGDARRRLNHLRKEADEEQADVEEIESSGKRALSAAGKVATSVAGRAAYEGLAALWKQVYS